MYACCQEFGVHRRKAHVCGWCSSHMPRTKTWLRHRAQSDCHPWRFQHNSWSAIQPFGSFRFSRVAQSTGEFLSLVPHKAWPEQRQLAKAVGAMHRLSLRLARQSCRAIPTLAPIPIRRKHTEHRTNRTMRKAWAAMQNRSGSTEPGTVVYASPLANR